LHFNFLLQEDGVVGFFINIPAGIKPDMLRSGAEGDLATTDPTTRDENKLMRIH